MGPLRTRQRADRGEVDGFDGLTRRGTYERLLMSEWLLADEVPDEFLRRAVAFEHTFLRLAHPSPTGSSAAVTLFDAGPSQLGRPRIVHIAALIVLARRAEEAGAQFAWGIMQAPEGPLFPGMAAAGVLHLLKARTVREASPADLEAWQRRIGGWKELDDLWIVGAPRVGTLPATRSASQLQVSEVLDVGGRAVKATMHRRATSADVALELPADEACARLLRDPFRVSVAPPSVAPSSFSPASNLVFSPNGAKLVARSRQGGLVVYPVPNSPRAGSGRPKLEPLASETVAYVGWDGQRLVVATTCEDGVDLRSASRSGKHPLAGRYLSTRTQPFQAPDPKTLLARMLLRCRGLSPDVRGLILDAEGALFDMTDDKRLFKRASRVSAIAPSPHGLAYVGQFAPDGPWELVVIGPSQRSFPLGGDASRAFFGFGEHLSHPFGLVAVERSPQEWTIRDAGGERRLIAPHGTKVLGVTRSPKRREEVGLVVLEDDGRTLSFVGRDWSRRLTAASSRIEHAVLSPTAAHVAYSTARGEVFVYSVDDDAFLYRFLPQDR
jgi:hypothetical protein